MIPFLSALSARCRHLQSLMDFQYVDPSTKRDEGNNVRTKAKALLTLIKDSSRIREVRERAAQTRAK